MSNKTQSSKSKFWFLDFEIDLAFEIRILDFIGYGRTKKTF